MCALLWSCRKSYGDKCSNGNTFLCLQGLNKREDLYLIIWCKHVTNLCLYQNKISFLKHPPVMRKRMWLNMGPYDRKCSQWWGTDHGKITTERPDGILLCNWPTAYSTNTIYIISVWEHVWLNETKSVNVVYLCFFLSFFKILLLDSAKFDIKFSFLSWYRIKNSVTLWTNRRDTRLNACSHIPCWLKKSALELSWHWTK